MFLIIFLYLAGVVESYSIGKRWRQVDNPPWSPKTKIITIFVSLFSWASLVGYVFFIVVKELSHPDWNKPIEEKDEWGLY